jgi:formylglycine-generating enzyme required for sulfatase activity
VSGSFRVRRGGSWDSVARFARVAIRHDSASVRRTNFLGVRLLRATP